MSSTILYKFRSGTNFTPLPLPGTSARLVDIKLAIIKSKKLDRNTTTGSLDFDFKITNASTGEEYNDDTMILPRGTRVVVRRVATDRNGGILHRVAQGNATGAGGSGGNSYTNNNSSSYNNSRRSELFTIRNNDDFDEDEFVDQDIVDEPIIMPQAPSTTTTTTAVLDETAELEALKAVTDQAASVYGSSTSSNTASGPSMNYIAGGGGPNNTNRGGPSSSSSSSQFNKSIMPQQSRPQRPNPDPEQRALEPSKKKTTTGIPRTFLSLNAPPPPPEETTEQTTDTNNMDGEPETSGGGLASQLNPNQHVFQALINRAGGQSLNDATGKRRDLDYALKLTATSIPEHLQCGICHSVVKNAMLVPCK